MDQNKKVALFRRLKVVFYCLGLPLFFMAVLGLSTVFWNKFPFVGTGNNVDTFAAIKVAFGGTSLYGVWIALAIWAFIGLVQIIAHYVIRNQKTRMFIVIFVILVTMLCPMFVMDAMFTEQIDGIAALAPDGVEVPNYKNQISYYRSHSSKDTETGQIDNKTYELVRRVQSFCRVYNVSYYGIDKGGTADNMDNSPICYDQLGIDFNKDGVINELDHILIRVAPTDAKIKKGLAVEGTGKLVLDGVSYDRYFFSPKMVDDKATYIWYDKEKMGEFKEGDYGYGKYNKNGLFSDGYIPSVGNSLRVLEDYYDSKAKIEKMCVENSLFKSFDDVKQEFYEDALDRQYAYYHSTPALEKEWEASANIAGNHSMTKGRLSQLFSTLGLSLGDQKIFDIIFEEFAGEELMEDLAEGIDIVAAIGSLKPDIVPTINTVLEKIGLEGLVIQLTYPNLHITVKETMEGDAIVDIPFDENFSLDFINDIVKGLLTNLNVSNDIYLKVTNILEGLITKLVGFEIDFGASIDEFDISNILIQVLESLYWYQSSIIKPAYMFYENELLPETNDSRIMGHELARYSKAYYEGAMHGKIMGSVLIGKKLGAGKYPAELGLEDLNAVRQLQTDLSFQPTMFPLFTVRDMLMVFATIVLVNTMLSYVCAMKEYEYAHGMVEAKESKRKKKSKKGKKAQKESEDSALNVDENIEKEVE